MLTPVAKFDGGSLHGMAVLILNFDVEYLRKKRAAVIFIEMLLS